MVVNAQVGPDVVVAGSARTGTSYLSSVLGQHSEIDPGSVKEPNFFSREFERGDDWYDGLYAPRSARLLRLDSSVSYTFPHFREALDRLAAASPRAFIVYTVREPLGRALSHYQLHRDYFQNEPAQSFGEAIRRSPLYAGASDYAYWIGRIKSCFPDEQTLIIPFTEATGGGNEVADLICARLGIGPVRVDSDQADAHRNNVVQFRNRGVLRVRRFVKKSGAYPWIRRTLGPERLRGLRGRLTRSVDRETLPQALTTCADEQLDELRRLYERAQAAVTEALRIQDARLGLGWASTWTASVPAASDALDSAQARTSGRP